jgi:hypothetical protein
LIKFFENIPQNPIVSCRCIRVIILVPRLFSQFLIAATLRHWRTCCFSWGKTMKIRRKYIHREPSIVILLLPLGGQVFTAAKL